MANSIANLHIRHSSAEAVEKVARNIVRESAYLSNPWGGWISLYDAFTEGDNPLAGPAELHRLAEMLSAGLGCPVFGFLVHHTSDALLYVAYDQGNLRDEYSSKPDYLGPVGDSRRQRLRGQPEVVKQYAHSSASLDDIKRFFSGSGTLGAHDDQFKDKVRQTIRSTSPESVGQMLGVAAQHLGQLPPEMLKETLGKAGVPMDHPMLAPFLQNPAMFLQQLAGNPMALKMMMDQVGAMSEASLDSSAPAAPAMPAEVRLLELARFLNVEPQRACLTFANLERGTGVDKAQFTRLS